MSRFFSGYFLLLIYMWSSLMFGKAITLLSDFKLVPVKGDEAEQEIPLQRVGKDQKQSEY